MRRILLAALCVLGLVSGASAQVTLQSGAVQTIRAGKAKNPVGPADSTQFRIAASGTTSDTSMPLSTSGWTRLGVQHKINAATLNLEYSIAVQYSNDRTNWVNVADSINAVVKAAGSAVSLDTLKVWPFSYLRFIANRSATNSTATTIATGTITISAKGVK